MTTLTVSVHDIAPSTTTASRCWVEALDARDVPATLLVVPGPWSNPELACDPDLVAWLLASRDRGHEIALHGWSHHADTRGGALRRSLGTIVARGAAEFWVLDREEAARRLRRGLAELERVGHRPVGFTPPGWLASRGTNEALRALGFRYTTSHRHVLDLTSGTRVAAPALCHRPGGRGERAGARLLVAATAHRARRGLPVRLGLHPADLDRPGLFDAAMHAIDEALRAGAQPTTYDRLIAANDTTVRRSA